MAVYDDLLEQARHLASREPRRPRQASLRRAVSAAYYALFHLLAAEGARQLSPIRPAMLRARIRRAFAHRNMQEVCRQFAAGGPNAVVTQLLDGPLQPELRQVANAFAELQDARHDADYNLATTFARIDVLQKVDLAEQAFAAWRVVRAEPHASVFLAALLLQHQWR
jgi:hypothetical protein